MLLRACACGCGIKFPVSEKSRRIDYSKKHIKLAKLARRRLRQAQPA
jgi:hypothetical protein